MAFLGIAAAGASVAKKVAPGIFQKPSPRYYGKLAGTLVELQEGVEGKTANLNNRTYNDVETVALMNRERKSDSGMQGIWTDLLPTWNPTPAARAAILAADPSFRFGGAAPALAADQPSSLSLVVEPLREGIASSADAGEAAVREGLAQAVERAGVGGAAALSREVRGTEGPLDRLIQFSEKPGGLVILAGGALVLVFGVAFVLGRR